MQKGWFPSCTLSSELMKLALNLTLCLQPAERGASGLNGVLAGAGVSEFFKTALPKLVMLQQRGFFF